MTLNGRERKFVSSNKYELLQQPGRYRLSGDAADVCTSGILERRLV